MKDLIKNAKYPNKLLKGIDDITLKEVKEFSNGEKLYALCLRLENICNYNCIYCGTYENRCKDNIMPIKEYLRIINEAANLGAKTVVLGGNGEPTMTVGLLEILELINNKKMTAVMFTNMSIFGNDDLCIQIHGIDGKALLQKIDNLNVSLIISCESIREEKYNQIVGSKSYQYFIKGIERLKKTNFVKYQEYQNKQLCRLALSSVIMPINYEDRYELLGFIHSLNGLLIAKVPSLHGAAKENIDMMYDVETAKKIKEELKHLSDKQATLQIFNLACIAWTMCICVNYNGNFMTCMTEENNPYKDYSNISDVNLSELLKKKRELLNITGAICPVKEKWYGKNDKKN